MKGAGRAAGIIGIVLASVWALAAYGLFFFRDYVSLRYVSEIFSLPPAFGITRAERFVRCVLLLKAPVLAAVVAGVLVHWGGRFRRLLHLGQHSPPLDFALGSLVINLFWIGTGFTRLWRGWVVVGGALVLGLPALASAFRGMAWRPEVKGLEEPSAGKNRTAVSWAVGSTVVLGLLYALLVFLHDLVPEVFFDSHVYHLALPNLWRHLGGITCVPGNFYSQYPFGGELLFVNGYWFGGEETAKCLNGIAYLMVGWAAYEWVALLSTWTAAWAVLGWVWTFPLLAYNAWNTQVECLLALFILLFFRWTFTALETSEKGSWAVAIAMGAGALAIKYTAVWALGAVALVFLWERLRSREIGVPRGIWKVGVLLFLVTAGPWAVRNLWDTGNPLSPYFTSLFGGDTLPPLGRLRLLAEQSNVLPVDAWWKWFWPLDKGTTRVDIADYIGPFALAFFFAALQVPPRGRAESLLRKSWVVMMFLAGWTTQVLRFHIPGVTVGLALAAAGWGRRFPRGLVFLSLLASVSAFACLGALCNVSVVHYQAAGLWAGSVEKNRYREAAGDTPYGGLARKVGEATAPSDRLLVVGDGRSLRYPRAAFAQTVFDTQWLVAFTRTSVDPDGLAVLLKRTGVDAVVVSGAEGLRRADDYQLFELSPPEWSRLAAFADRWLEPVFNDRTEGLWRLRNSPARAPGDPAVSASRVLALLSPFGVRFQKAYNDKRWADAVKALDALAELFPTSPTWPETRARVRARLGDSRGALADFAKARKLGKVSQDSEHLAKEWHRTN